MIHFCLVHTAYRLHCWLPRSHRLSQVTVLLLGISTLTLQFYVLLRALCAAHSDGAGPVGSKDSTSGIWRGVLW
uniref:Transmembrame protein 274 n=1 Tax=Mus musculus TaxID=10090 RepID=A0A2R8W6Q8_MOUSE